MDTDLFMKRWILLMKYCEVKTKKQIYLVFLDRTCSWEFYRHHLPPLFCLYFIF